MTGACTIDGTDIATLGMLILKGGDNDFLAFPERKEPLQNDWFEEDGLDVDLSEIYFKERKINVRFHMSSLRTVEFLNNLDALYALLNAPGYRRVYVREFNKTFLLRYVSCSAFSMRGGLIKIGTKSADFTVQFNMDDPLQQFDKSILHPVSTKEIPTYVVLNGIDLSGFGITVQNIYNTALQLPSPKHVLTRNFDKYNGMMTDVNVTQKKAYNPIIVRCIMSAATREEFHINYNALFNQLAKTESLTIGIQGRDYPCYYSKMDSFRKMLPFSGGVYISFNIHLKRI